jgi:phosphoglycerate dehydrogenase-like enzyme
VLAPHIGYNTREIYEVFFTDVVEDIAAWLRGKPQAGTELAGVP